MMKLARQNKMGVPLTHQYLRAASEDLSSSASMKKMKSGNDIPVCPKPPSLPSENGLSPTWKILQTMHRWQVRQYWTIQYNE